MPALQHNPELLVSAFLRLARKQDDPIEWVEQLQTAALTGGEESASGVIERMQDQFAGSVNTEGGNTTWLRELSCVLLAQLCEAALRVLQSEAAQEEAGLPVGPTGDVRYADFSSRPCTLG